jgi:hypothetical protein
MRHTITSMTIRCPLGMAVWGRYVLLTHTTIGYPLYIQGATKRVFLEDKKEISLVLAPRFARVLRTYLLHDVCDPRPSAKVVPVFDSETTILYWWMSLVRSQSSVERHWSLTHKQFSAWLRQRRLLLLSLVHINDYLDTSVCCTSPHYFHVRMVPLF